MATEHQACANGANQRPSLMERAFDLARTGASLEAIRRQLSVECYWDVDLQLSARTLKRQLKAAGAQTAERSRSRQRRKFRDGETVRQAPSLQFKKCAICARLLTLEAYDDHVHASAPQFTRA